MAEIEQYSAHIPVLRDQFVEAMFSDPDGCYVDCTFGRGGHSRELLAKLSAKGRLLAIDRDPEAIIVGQKLAAEDERFSIEHSDFGALGALLDVRGWYKVSGIGFDLGVSSPQVDDATRGFSFRHSGPLDMRMDSSQGKSLLQLLEHVSERDLIEILRKYGDERYAQRIARAILKAQHASLLATTAELENICFHAVPKKARYGTTHPATRTFQALRIWVNDEMGQIDHAIEAAIDHLQDAGQLAVISFHSGEDRRIRDLIESHVHACICPPQMPICVCGKKPTMRWLQKKPLRASEQELETNPRSRSSMLRVAQRLSEQEGLKLSGYSGVSA
ncbi:MAG: 16S rRNA (cytosine(1402)-N(4))-methyltransferase RsmH [Mariprofundus sp.]|nr:16S rRNA (cytosine(1402)-N(4))-methyltransferase RsmH [Mariprofundus sp.]